MHAIMGSPNAAPRGSAPDRPIRYRILNVFSCEEKPHFTGNPLTVVEDARGLTPEAMQAIAAQFNLSETAFILPTTHGRVAARYFTPRYELPFAGHPTLGTAHAVRSLGLGGDRLTLDLPVGPIDVSVDGDVWRFTAPPHRSRTVSEPPGLLARALGLDETDLGGNARFVSTGTEQLIVPVASAQALERACPDPRMLAHFRTDAGRYMAYLVHRATAARFHVRFFFPTAGGMSEDPGTGSACANLGGYLLDEGVARPRTIEVIQGESLGRINRLLLSPTNDARIRVGGRVHELGGGALMLPTTCFAPD